MCIVAKTDPTKFFPGTSLVDLTEDTRAALAARLCDEMKIVTLETCGVLRLTEDDMKSKHDLAIAALRTAGRLLAANDVISTAQVVELDELTKALEVAQRQIAEANERIRRLETAPKPAPTAVPAKA